MSTLFFNKKESGADYKLYLLLVGILLGSVILSCLFKKLPAIGAVVSLIPISLIATTYADGALPQQPMLYLVLSAIHTVGALYECIRCDREHSTHHAHLAANLIGILGALGALFVWSRAKEDPSILLTVSVLLLVTVLLSFLWREVYFLDAAVALLPALLVVPKALSGNLPICAEFLFVMASVNLLFRIAIMLSCQPSKKTDRAK